MYTQYYYLGRSKLYKKLGFQEARLHRLFNVAASVALFTFLVGYYAFEVIRIL